MIAISIARRCEWIVKIVCGSWGVGRCGFQSWLLQARLARSGWPLLDGTGLLGRSYQSRKLESRREKGLVPAIRLKARLRFTTQLGWPYISVRYALTPLMPAGRQTNGQSAAP